MEVAEKKQLEDAVEDGVRENEENQLGGREEQQHAVGNQVKHACIGNRILF